MRLSLPDVTICAADSVNMELTARALRQSMAGCDFADALLFSHQPVAGPFRSVRIAPLSSSADYSAFILKQLRSFIATPFVLVVQWDGYVLDPTAWSADFRDYDYIGAKWDWHGDGLTVGNGGFSLRSRRLLDALADPSVAMVPGRNEDELIGRTYRPMLERDWGIRFAPEAVADRFSYERTVPIAPSFGFHGLFNMWRHVGTAEMIDLVGRMNPYVHASREFIELILHYLQTGERSAALALYQRLRAGRDADEVLVLMRQKLQRDQLARQCWAACEDLERSARPAGLKPANLSQEESMVQPERYLSLLKKALCNELYVEAEAEIVYLLHCVVNNQAVDLRQVSQISTLRPLIEGIANGKQIGRTLHVTSMTPTGEERVWHSLRGAVEIAHTMIGRKRLDNLQDCLDAVRRDNVPGDLIETGIWRGGATIFMRGYLEAHGIRDRTVWAADSFEGLPESTLPQDQGVDLSRRAVPFLAVSLEEVQALFRRYDLLDDQVRFLKGWFRDTLPQAPIDRLAVLRLDGDLYESTMDALTALYHKVSPGGFIIVDDYYTNPTCLNAIHDFRRARNITEPMTDIDADAVFWRKG